VRPPHGGLSKLARSIAQRDDIVLFEQTAGEIGLAFAAALTLVQVKSTAGSVTLTVPGGEKTT
jgi:hypothetical protein